MARKRNLADQPLVEAPPGKKRACRPKQADAQKAAAVGGSATSGRDGDDDDDGSISAMGSDPDWEAGNDDDRERVSSETTPIKYSREGSPSGKRSTAPADKPTLESAASLLKNAIDRAEVGSQVSPCEERSRSGMTFSAHAIAAGVKPDADHGNDVKKASRAMDLCVQEDQFASTARVMSRSGRIIRPVANRYSAAMTATRRAVPTLAHQLESPSRGTRVDDDAAPDSDPEKYPARQPKPVSASGVALEEFHCRLETIRAGLSALVTARETAMVDMASREVESSEEWESALRVVDERWKEGRRKAVVRWILGRGKTAREMEARQVERQREEGSVRLVYLESVGKIRYQMMLHAKLELMNAIWGRESRGNSRASWLGMGHNSRNTLLRLLQCGVKDSPRPGRHGQGEAKAMTKAEILIAINTEARRKKKRLWKLADLEARDQTREEKNEEGRRQSVDEWYAAVDRIWDDWCLRIDAVAAQSKMEVLPRKIRDILV